MCVLKWCWPQWATVNILQVYRTVLHGHFFQKSFPQLGIWKRWWRALSNTTPKISKRCSIGLTSGDCEGHHIQSTLSNHITSALWMGDRGIPEETTLIRIEMFHNGIKVIGCLGPFTQLGPFPILLNLRQWAHWNSKQLCMHRGSLKEPGGLVSTYAENHQTPLGIARGFWCNVQ